MEDNKLITLIDKYLDEYDKMQKDYEKYGVLKDLYSELLVYLEGDYESIKENKIIISFLISEIYKDDVYLNEFYNIIQNLGETKENRDRFRYLRKSIYKDSKEIETKMEELKVRLFRNRYIPSSAKRVKLCLIHNIPLNQNKYDIPNIKRILNYFEASGTISNKEELLLINELELYNRRITSEKNQDKDEQEYADGFYNEVPNIIYAGFQEHDVIEVNDDRKPMLDKFVKELLNYVEYLDKDDIIDNIERYHNFNLDDNEFNYIIVSILNKYLDDLLTLYQLLIDKDVYMNRKDRLDVVKSYYRVLDRYTYLLKYYNDISSYEPEESEEIDEPSCKDEEKKELIYSHSSNSDKIKIISDMKDVPFEYYKTVSELIDNFINNKISKKEIKFLNNNGHLTQFIELKNDQVRIVLKHIKDNIYCVMGVGVKKSDNDITMYRTLANRPIPNISTSEKLARELELSDFAKQEIEKITTEKGRKGTR